jgi:hypothetical protein
MHVLLLFVHSDLSFWSARNSIRLVMSYSSIFDLIVQHFTSPAPPHILQTLCNNLPQSSLILSHPIVISSPVHIDFTPPLDQPFVPISSHFNVLVVFTFHRVPLNHTISTHIHACMHIPTSNRSFEGFSFSFIIQRFFGFDAHLTFRIN